MQKEVNEKVDDISDKLFDSINSDVDYVLNKVDRVRKEVNSILLEYANKDGKIPHHRIQTLLRELDKIESSIEDEIVESIEEFNESTADKTSKHLVEAIVATVGVSMIAGKKRPNRSEITNEVTEFMSSREINGITTEKRIDAVSGILRDTMQQSIRYGVITGESATTISRRVKKAVDRAVWQVKRIVTSEIPTAFRKTIATVGNKLGVIQAVKIIDNRGRHKYHESHECYKLAEQDKYGWGKGVYKTSDGYIFDPHPQCSAYFRYILKKHLTEGGDE